MNPHIGAAMWIIAMLVGFVIWWPIGAMILASITLVALSQQITGYQVNPQPPPQRQPLRPPQPLHWSEVHVVNPQLTQAELMKIGQTKVLQITDQSRR